MREIKVTNMTSLFNKDMLIYSFFDIRLKQPLKVVGVLYFILLFLIIGLPVLLITWPPNVYAIFVIFGVPFGGSMLMSKPIWNGKSFGSFFKTQLKYFKNPKVLYDWKARPKTTEYEIESQIIVSRHKDYNLLSEIVQEEEALKYG